MIPFYIFYSMFGFQRTGDQIWAFGDARGRGFLMGATAGRTTLTGEGLQHDDGHSHILASTVPNMPRLRPRLRLRAGDHRARGDPPHVRRAGEDVFYYLTLYNENWAMPAKPDGVEDGILRGLYRFRAAERGHAASSCSDRARSCTRRSAPSSSSPSATTWPPTCGASPSSSSCATTRWTAERWNRLHPEAEAARPVRRPAARPDDRTDRRRHRLPQGGARAGRAAGSTARSPSLGTDGFGRCDTREALRIHFEVSPEQIAYAALHGLCLGRREHAGGAARGARDAGDRPGAPEPGRRLAHPGGREARPPAGGAVAVLGTDHRPAARAARRPQRRQRGADSPSRAARSVTSSHGRRGWGG